MKTYYVYILTNKYHTTLYTGVTNNLQRRIIEHKLGKIDGFSKKYKLNKLIYIEQHTYACSAIQREKTIKHWPRKWKIALVERDNQKWTDLYEQFFGCFDENAWCLDQEEIPAQRPG